MLYGRLVHSQTLLTTEEIREESSGVIRERETWYCKQCGTREKEDFYTYIALNTSIPITYCRRCIQMGRMSTVDKIWITQSKQSCSKGYYSIPFKLSEQQCYASERILEAVRDYRSLLLHAVTGAGKTEMIFAAIAYARQRGDNVAVVSPRVDVVIEVSKRLRDAFKDEMIDVLHQQSQQRYNGHFVVATVHQLYRFKKHFDVLFVDEVDAFPLSMDPSLMHILHYASKAQKSAVYMTATPPHTLKRQFCSESIITLPARFHRHPLVVPTFKYFKVRYHRIQFYLLHQIRQQQAMGRTTLLFFSNIRQMCQFYKVYQSVVSNICFVYSEDPERLLKVEALRKGEYSVVLTTTILERGFTMAFLDVWVMEAHCHSSSTLIQIAGRVGRKVSCPTGIVHFFHEGRTWSMYQARANIKFMNKCALERGWID
ncbi:DEAD/DEAH box helicase family protein [Staphylococcus sp. 17KM0847]|uniref:DEAD/DEAH box helicase family protein n=1 Tax=Staphylococcus sp. 17KM0847 TaxID=2583989 RepID=UPI0015DBEFD4|nr:DEAD/DEAH box helicase family protein [Staphylococcus sp. 17KM0847]QLK85525.1 DEAD/DEAH box helicase [Staphylococcus sp. 17KM0847]